jgi:hypothetical protein
VIASNARSATVRRRAPAAAVPTPRRSTAPFGEPRLSGKYPASRRNSFEACQVWAQQGYSSSPSKRVLARNRLLALRAGYERLGRRPAHYCSGRRPSASCDESQMPASVARSSRDRVAGAVASRASRPVVIRHLRIGTLRQRQRLVLRPPWARMSRTGDALSRTGSELLR